MRLKITEALLAYNETAEKRMKRRELATMVFPNTDPRVAAINLKRLDSGEAKTVNMELLLQLCEILGTTPNFLFGFNI